MTSPVQKPERAEPDFAVAYLGPEGSFAHLVAQQRYQEKALIPFGTIPEVFDYVEENDTAKGVVPIENSSGGLILNTVDGIIEHACTLFIEEELSIDVKLALLGKKGVEITTVYSHFAPLQHCEPYLKEKHPRAKAVISASTSAAAEAALAQPGGAAIGRLAIADIYGLEVLDYPLRNDVPNVTQFFVVSHTRQDVAASEKTSLVVALPNHPGSLVDLLQPFAAAGVNLTRIQSRPVPGQPNTYLFLIELKGSEKDAAASSAIDQAKAASTRFYNVGSYPVMPRFQTV